jgi:hypothetical protein
MELFRTLKAISGWDGTDVSQTVTPPRAPSGAKNWVIADFYGSSDNVVKRFYEILLKIRPCFSFAWIQFLERKKSSKNEDLL